ncbi:MAG: PKD domain-containing protein, partial [Bacteroidales bacterium]|nr:PKD domain-containing protein [Bacteroidales bacterium]
NWSFGDGSSTTTESPTHEFINTLTSDKTFAVRMDAESVNGCTDYAETVITVYSKVIADFSIETSEGCPPFSTSIDNTSIGNVSNSYEWQIDGVLVGGSPTDKSDFDHTYENLATLIRDYEVKLIATNPHGCTSEHIDTVTVYEYVKASYSMDIDNGCTPLPINFTDLSLVPASTKYTWDFGDGASSGLSDPVHTFYNPSRTADLTYTIDLTVQSPNYCTDDTSMVIDVYHQPLATMYVPTTTSCPPLEAYMDNFNSKGYDSFEWRFGDGNTNTIDNSLVYSYTSLPDAVKYYDLKLWVGTDEGCTHTDSITLSVFPDVIADFTYDVAGCSPFTSSFINESSATAEFFSWNFDDGTTSSQRDPIHRFENTTHVDKDYNVRLFTRNEYECSDDTIQVVTVYAQPTALFNPTPAVQTYPEATVWLNSTSNDEPWDYLWEFGDLNGTTSTSSNQILFEYAHWGEKDIKLTLSSQTSNCSDNLTKSVIIYPPEVNAAFTTDIDGGCLDEGLEVQFTAAGSAYAEVYNYTWDFGDGETGNGANIYHTYESAGVFYVKMTASSNEGAGEDYEYKTIRVYSNPKASFEVSPKLVMLNTDLEARVEFFNLSECNDTSGCAYVWDFGDGNTSISRDVTHNYSPDPDDVPIKYDISLLVTTAHSCVDSLTLYEEVEIIGAGQIEFPNAFTPNGDGLNDTFRPVSEGVIKYELLVYNRWGELIFTTKDLSAGWDGTINNEYAKPDVYVWKALGKFTNGRSFELAGDVTLIR